MNVSEPDSLRLAKRMIKLMEKRTAISHADKGRALVIAQALLESNKEKSDRDAANEVVDRINEIHRRPFITTLSEEFNSEAK